MDRVWEGEYETSFFMNYSVNFKICKSLIFRKKEIIGYIPDFWEDLSLPTLCHKLSNKYLRAEVYGRSVNGHWFMFKYWKKSIMVRYFIDTLFIIAIA